MLDPSRFGARYVAVWELQRKTQEGWEARVRGSKQLKVGLRVRDLDASCALYLRLGFRQIPHDDQPNLRYLTFGLTWLILSGRYSHGYHSAERENAAKSGPLGSGFVLAIPTPDLDAVYDLWRQEGLRVTLEPQDVFWARIFYGLDPDGYELMFEQHHDGPGTSRSERDRLAAAPHPVRPQPE